MLPLVLLLSFQLTFEVASVKRSDPASQAPPLQVTNGGGFNANITLDTLLQIAYKVKPFQVVDAPAWTHTEHYTIAARPPDGYKPKQPGRIDDDIAERLKSLLIDRFHLVARREMREMPAYV